MNPNSATLTLAKLATTIPQASRVFQRHHLDYCCAGDQTLAAACADNGLQVTDLMAEIAAETPAPTDRRWDLMTVNDLIQHIESRYHFWLWNNLDPLLQLAQKVAAVHGAHHPALHEVEVILTRLVGETKSHLQKEEQVLFPLARAATVADYRGPIDCLRHDHEEHGSNLLRIRSLCDDYRVPAGACDSWRALHLRLEELEAELMAHIHLENHVLFPQLLPHPA